MWGLDSSLEGPKCRGKDPRLISKPISPLQAVLPQGEGLVSHSSHSLWHLINLAGLKASPHPVVSPLLPPLPPCGHCLSGPVAPSARPPLQPQADDSWPPGSPPCSHTFFLLNPYRKAIFPQATTTLPVYRVQPSRALLFFSPASLTLYTQLFQPQSPSPGCPLQSSSHPRFTCYRQRPSSRKPPWVWSLGLCFHNPLLPLIDDSSLSITFGGWDSV